MFPFQRSCELSFKISDEGDQVEQANNSFENQIILNNNAIVGVPNVDFTLNNSTTTAAATTTTINPGRGRGRGRGRRSSSSSSLAGTSTNINTNNNVNDEDERKTMHREYERQRRQEMANLYNSLRSTLPDEYTQGKRSISDHVGGAINYITNLKTNVKELEEKRDQLIKQSVESTSSIREYGGSSNTAAAGSCCSVVIRESVVGLEVELSIASENEDRFLLSTALQVVFEEGLEVVSCTSTRFSDRLIHIMQCQVGNMTCIELNRLQQRLSNIVC